MRGEKGHHRVRDELGGGVMIGRERPATASASRSPKVSFSHSGGAQFGIPNIARVRVSLSRLYRQFLFSREEKTLLFRSIISIFNQHDRTYAISTMSPFVEPKALRREITFSTSVNLFSSFFCSPSHIFADWATKPDRPQKSLEVGNRFTWAAHCPWTLVRTAFPSSARAYMTIGVSRF